MTNICFVYIPDFIFINDEQTPLGILSLHSLLERDQNFSAQIIDFNQLLFSESKNGATFDFESMIQYIVNKLTKIEKNLLLFYSMCSNY